MPTSGRTVSNVRIPIATHMPAKKNVVLLLECKALASSARARTGQSLTWLSTFAMRLALISKIDIESNIVASQATGAPMS